jgi:hypothetical protein
MSGRHAAISRWHASLCPLRWSLNAMGASGPMGKKKDKAKVDKKIKKLKKAMKKAGKKGRKVDRSDVPLVDPPPSAGLI